MKKPFPEPLPVLTLVLLLAASLACGSLPSPASTPPVEGAAGPPPQAPAVRAAALLEAQGELLRRGHREEVLEGVGETISLYREAGDLRGEATALLLRALARWGLRGGSPTAEDLEAARERFEAADDLFGAWLMTWLMADSASQEGRLETAAAHLRDGLAMVERVRTSPLPLDFSSARSLGTLVGSRIAVPPLPESAGSLLNPILANLLEVPLRETLVTVSIWTNRLDEAGEELDRAFEKSGLFAALFHPRLHLLQGDLQRARWELDAARVSYGKALGASDPLSVGGGTDVAWSRKVVGRLEELESLAGRFDDALSWNDRSLALAREAEEPSWEARALLDRSGLYHQRGRLAEADRLLEEAAATYRRAGDEVGLAHVLADRGTRALMRGDYGEAARFLEEGTARFRELEEPFQEASLLLLLVEAYQNLGASDRTEEILRRARELGAAGEHRSVAVLARALEALNRSGGDADAADLRLQAGELAAMLDAFAWVSRPADPGVMLAMTALAAGDAGEAAEVARQVLARGDRPLGEALSRLVLGVALFQQGEWQGAEEELVQAVEGLDGIGSRDPRGMALAALAALRWRQDRKAEAVETMERATAVLDGVLERVPVEELLASYLGEGRGSLYGAFVDMLMEVGRPRDAFVQAERSRARALLRLLGNQRLRPLTGSGPVLVEQANALRAEIDRLQQRLPTATPQEVRILDSELRRARKRYEDLLVRLKVQSPQYASLASVDPLPSEQVQAALEPGVTLVSYFLGAKGGHAWVMDRDHFDGVPLSLDRDELLELSCWAREVGRARGVTPLGGCEPSPDRAERFHRRLIAPVAGHLRGERLVIVPHGLLHYVPFAALRDPETGRYLVEDREITLLPGASLLPLLGGQEAPVTGSALVLGAPAAADPRLPELPGARAEAAEVAALFGVEPLLGEAATEARVWQPERRVGLLHVAAHGLLQPDHSRFSRLVLAPGGGHDGDLEVHEIFASLDLSGVGLVVLSACQTAVGPDSGGDEIVSLARAFLYAGSPGVVSTLWPVHDAASAELMTTFYRHLLAGATPAGALRRAQVEMARAGRDPYFWAGYTLTGDPRRRWGTASGPRTPAALAGGRAAR